MMTQEIETFGSTLARAREKSGVTLRHIADATNLSVGTLTALEKNRITQLPGGIYRRAIVRSYASHVGLDPETTLRAFLTQYPDDVPTWADLVPAHNPPRVRGAMHALINAMSAFAR